ncbi:Protein of unknown function [Pyronema omphalodes CBS 100304]|uniref:Uncharacterized protein n=1 Tax=Pyronema omphalodes (strain CBS 100304) TaxID=1076935 RepID=U4KZE5_PYROM|nr:Protein of unknown function [Pyronema omphalodes CBS 100304]
MLSEYPDVPPGPGPFAATIRHERDDLDERDLQNLNGHRVSRELADKVFKRIRANAPSNHIFDLSHVSTHPELTESVSSGSDFSRHHSRRNTQEFSTENESSNLNLPPEDESSVANLSTTNDYHIPNDVETTVKASDSRHEYEPPPLDPDKPIADIKGKGKETDERATRPTLNLLIPSSASYIKDAFDLDLSTGRRQSYFTGSRVLDLFHFDSLDSRINSPLPAVSRLEENADLVQECDDDCKLSDPEDIECLLDRMLITDQVEYEHDLHQIALRERAEKNARLTRNSSISSRTRYGPRAFNSSPRYEEIHRPDFSDGRHNRPTPASSALISNGRHSRTNPILYEQTIARRHFTTPFEYEKPSAAENNESNTSRRHISAPYDQEQLITGINNRLFDQVRFNRGVTRHRQSGPSEIERPGVLERSPAFNTEPSGASFAAIFTVAIPQASSIGTPLSRLGRPIIAETTDVNFYTVVATYHPVYQYVVVDMMDYCYCPVGFESGQIADLIYLQANKYLPSHSIWPAQNYGSQRYHVTSKWSLCIAAANGIDHLYVSDVDVLAQRIAGCMWRINEGRNMSDAEHSRFIANISEGCAEVCEVELFSKARSMRRNPRYTTVSMDFSRNAVYEWRPLTDQPHHQLPHSRNAMPIRKV